MRYLILILFVFVNPLNSFADLVEAIYCNNIEEVQTLISQGADVNKLNENGELPLNVALIPERGFHKKFIISGDRKTNFEIVNELIKKGGAKINAKDRYGYTPFMYSIMAKATSLSLEMIEKKADIEAETNGRISNPLQLAIDFDPVVALKLIEVGADVNRFSMNAKFSYPILRAAHICSKELVQALISKGADVNARAQREYATPLIYVALECNDFWSSKWRSLTGEIEESVASVLISNGAQLNDVKQNGDTALIIAARNDRYNLASDLISQKADVHLVNEKGENALIAAAINGSARLVPILVDAKIDLDAQDLNGNTALHVSADRGFRDFVDKLILSGANVEIKNKLGETPLILAVEKGHEISALRFIQTKKGLNAQNKAGQSVLQIAKRKGLRKIVEALEEVLNGKQSGTSSIPVNQVQTKVEALSVSSKEEKKADQEEKKTEGVQSQATAASSSVYGNLRPTQKSVQQQVQETSSGAFDLYSRSRLKPVAASPLKTAEKKSE